MLGRIGKIFVVTAVIFSIGLHWNFLQVVAWGSMLVRYAQDASLSEAVEKTFDGEHPCCMCKAIEKGKQEERKLPQQKQDERKLELFCIARPARIVPPFVAFTLPAFRDRGELLPAAPPLPPPRAA